ncbi:transposase [Streptosporangium sp. NPDC023615]|uniref:transposase n=1 Tax=Streptosporangium sp. NPDC023615 TaxID=3154794 RepID=UPI00341C9870
MPTPLREVGMSKRYPPEFRRKLLDLLKAGRTVRQAAFDLQISDQTIYNWREQELIDTGQKPGITSSGHTELAVTRRAAELLREAVPPRGGSRPSR